MDILRVDFQGERAIATVAMREPYHTSSRPDLAQELLGLVPALREHRCYNDDNLSFEEEATRTEIPHLFEHLVLELQAASLCLRRFAGETHWNWRRQPRGQFYVEVDAPHPALALASLRAGLRMLRAVADGRAHDVDLEGELRLLRHIARLPEDTVSRAPIDDFGEWLDAWDCWLDEQDAVGSPIRRPATAGAYA